MPSILNDPKWKREAGQSKRLNDLKCKNKNKNQKTEWKDKTTDKVQKIVKATGWAYENILKLKSMAYETPEPILITLPSFFQCLR